MTNNENFTQRRYDLDWLRIIAFGLLILYHVGMFFDAEPWHVKSQYANSDWRPLMNLLNPWRLPLLFFISGVAIKYASDKYGENLLAFTKKRFNFLMIPLLFGMFVVVAPQTYYELLLTRQLIEPGFFNFYTDYIDFDQKWPQVFTPTYNHLWYVLYMLIYTLVYLVLKIALDKVKAPKVFDMMMKTPLFLVVPILPFIVYRFTSDIAFPETHDISQGDWGAHIRYGSYFLLGILVAKSKRFWQSVDGYWKTALCLAVICLIALPSLWANWESFQDNALLMDFIRSLRIFYVWWVFIGLLGLAKKYLNKPSASLSYLTEAIFPYYILHQTITVIAGAFITSYSVGILNEFIFVYGATIIGCVVLHEYIIRRVKLIRPLFGLKA